MSQPENQTKKRFKIPGPDVAELGYTHVHRLTPLLRLWTVLLAFIAIMATNINAGLLSAVGGFVSGGHLVMIAASVVALLAFFGVVWFVSLLWWRAEGYRLAGEELSIRRGVFGSNLRSARYDRIQAVDVVESVIARIFGLAILRVETAGGTDSVLEISYLPKSRAEELRRDVLDRAHGEVSLGDAALGDGVVGNGEVELSEVEGGVAKKSIAKVGEQRGVELVPTIPISRSLAAAALQIGSIITLLAIIPAIIFPPAAAGLVPVLLGAVSGLWKEIDRSWSYTALIDDGKLHVSYGLADRRKQTIPLDRIHAVEVMQPMLWRFKGWWRVRVSVAGYGALGGANKESGTTTLLPVGSLEQAMEVLAAIGPLNAETAWGFAHPEGFTEPTYTSPRSARWVSPIDRKQQAVTLLDDAAVVATHSGRLARRVQVVEATHIQELTLREGPIQQACGVCTVRFDLVPGPVGMAGRDLTPADGRALLDTLRGRALPSM